MSKAELILQYLKTLIWPVVVVFILLSFRGQIGNFLGDVEEAEVFGAKLKAKSGNIKELEKKERELKDELDKLFSQLKEQENLNGSLVIENKNLGEKLLAANVCNETGETPGTPDGQAGDNTPTPDPAPPIAIEDAERLSEESRQLKGRIQNQYDRTQQIVQKSRFERAREFEESGFNQLVEEKFEDALESFDEAYNVFPAFHNVDEIRKLLRRNLERLKNPETANAAKREVFGEILLKYQWGVPKESERRMRAKLEQFP